MTTNRETIRDHLVSDLTTALVDTKLVKSVVGYKVRQPKALAPLVQVLSAGAGPNQLTYGEVSSDECWFYFSLQVLVPAKESGWTDANAEDKLDEIEYEIRKYVQTDRDDATWKRIEYAGRSIVEDVSPGGLPYKFENIPLRVWLLNE